MDKDDVTYVDPYTMEYYSAMKKKESLPPTTTWMDLEHIMLSEISQTKTSVVWYYFYKKSKKATLI